MSGPERPTRLGIGRALAGLRRRAVRSIGPAAARPDPFAGLRSIDGPALVPTPAIEHDPDADSRPALIVLVPHLRIGRMTGGPNTALNLAGRLAARGVRVRLLATDGSDADEATLLRSHVERLSGLAPESGELSFESVSGAVRPLRLGRGDVLVATWWPTAHIARRAVDWTSSSEFLYLVQDYEPAFYPWSTKHALALRTYDFPARFIFNESLLREHYISTRVGRFASDDAMAISTAFEPAVDRALFRAQRQLGPKRLLFYARPRNPRNAFELGLRALRVAVERGAFEPDWEFLSIGGQVPELPLAPGRTLMPVPWQSLPDYAALLGGSHVLLSLMLSPHTSYPPLEMAAAGGAVVTNVFGVKTRHALERISPIIRAVEPDVQALAAALAEAAKGASQAPEHRAELSVPASWDISLEPVVDWIIAAMEDLPRSRPAG